MSELYTTIKTDQGDVKIKQDDKELQKVVSLIYSLDQEINQLEAQIEKIKTMLEEKDEAYNCMGHTNSAEIKRFIKHLLKEIENGN